jgi:hypothetical protein
VTSGSSKQWTLWRGEELAGTITIDDGDFPWLEGTWAPAAAFSELEPLFRDELRLLLESEEKNGDGWEEWERAYDRIRAVVQLRYPEGGVVPEFLLHVDVDEQRAWFRWNDEPFGD